MKQVILLLLFALALQLPISAQDRRYFDEIFPTVKISADKVYGVNATVLYLASPLVGQAIPEQLKTDIYEPENDTAPSRPLVILLHTGNFLPPQVNGGCSGTRKDADNVAIATRLAKMGYVAAVADYRLGWNPVATSQTERAFTLINALYRGVQDSRTCVRFFKKDAATNNAYKIDPDKITLWGFGTGGYIALASAMLDTITDLHIPKFLTPQFPMVLEAVNGNVDGSNTGINIGFPGLPYPFGDTLCYPNHVGYDSDFALAVNLSGALADTSWIEAGEIPVVSFHNPTDPYAPCGSNLLIGPPFLPIFQAFGSCFFQPIINNLGNQNALINANLNDVLSVKARTFNGNIEGFYPFLGADPIPWTFASSSNPYGLTNDPGCKTMATTHSTYMDTIMRYFAPRACAVLGLSPDCQLVGTNNLNPSQIGFSIIPNPSKGDFSIRADAQYTIQSIELVDVAGRRVVNFQNVNNSQFDVKRNNLASGVYFARVQFKEGLVVQKVVLH